jgi:amidohydrolase
VPLVPIVNRIAEYQDELTAWRRYLHERPELGYEEHETAAFVADKLRGFGCDEVHTKIGRTGIVAVVRGQGDGRAIALRADMDALPIQEETGASWASRVPGRMHACGHDGHTAMLLGAARYLAETRNFDGTAYLIFQPAEEGGAGGRAMIEDRLFERFPAEQVFGLHNWPYARKGTFAMCEGPAMAASDELTIVLTGTGCHAAMPHFGRDPISAAAALIQSLQALVAREVDPIDNAVISITRLSGGDAYNVVPERVEEVVRGVGLAHGVTGKVRFAAGYPATINPAREAAIGADVAAEIVGEGSVERAPPPCMGSEDFAFMLRERPGSYIWMGTGGEGPPQQLHSPRYDFNDDALPLGTSYWVRLVERLLPRAV